MRKYWYRLKVNIIKVRKELVLRGSTVFDFLMYQLFSLRPARTTSDERHAIAFIGEQIPARVGRMAKWIRRLSPYTPVLVCKDTGYIPEFAEDHFHEVILYRNSWHLRLIMKKIAHRIRLVHAFAPKSFYPSVVLKHSNLPFIHDMQDVLVTYYGLTPPFGWVKKELGPEAYCLQHADSVIGQSLEPIPAFRRYGIKKRPNTFYFPLFCDDDASLERSPLSESEVHVVYAGGVAGSHRDPKLFGHVQFHGLIQTLAGQGIHFHMYPSPSSLKVDYEEYHHIARNQPYFHLHAPVAQHELANELGKYHFGIHLSFYGGAHQDREKYRYCTALKLFNFLEAGLPVLISRDLEYQSWMVERFKVGLSVGPEDLQNLGTIIASLDYASLRGNIYAVRKNQLSLARNIPRLLAHYERVIQLHSSKQ